MEEKTGKSKNKSLVISIYRILQAGDRDHPLDQAEIIRRLKDRYGLSVARDGVRRNIEVLKENGVEIEHSPRKGYYIAKREFSEAELTLLIDSVIANRNISKKKTTELVEKLVKQAGENFSAHMDRVQKIEGLERAENSELFQNIELIDRAIGKKQIQFSQVHRRRIDGKTVNQKTVQTVSPYGMLIKDGRYYLIGQNMDKRQMYHYRIDRITDVKILDIKTVSSHQLTGYQNGIDYKQYARLPYFFSDPQENIVLRVRETALDQVFDAFGKPKITDTETEGIVRVSVKSSPLAVKYWALGFINDVEIVSPKHLREDIAGTLDNGHKKYAKREKP